MRQLRLVITVLTCWAATLSVGLLERAEGQQDRRTIVASTTQVADFARQIVGDRWIVECVLGPGQDPHTYQVSARDAVLVRRADLCLENGWNLEGHNWMQQLARSAGKPIVTCIEGVQPLMMDEEGDQARDPHAWFDPTNAAIYVRNILAAVIEMDPDHADEYRARAELYLQQLRALDSWIQRQVAAISANRRVLVTHHDAFGYFCQRYHFRAVSPAGWTTGELTDISLGRRQEVVQAVREIGVRAIFVETSINPELIRQIARETGVEVGGQLYSDAMGPADSAGATYIGMMRENVLTIVRALRD